MRTSGKWVECGQERSQEYLYNPVIIRNALVDSCQGMLNGMSDDLPHRSMEELNRIHAKLRKLYKRWRLVDA